MAHTFSKLVYAANGVLFCPRAFNEKSNQIKRKHKNRSFENVPLVVFPHI